MMISYDNDVKAVYITLLSEAKVAKTVEFAPETYLDFTKNGELIGVEMLSPSRDVLKRIAKKFNLPELSRIRPDKLLQVVS